MCETATNGIEAAKDLTNEVRDAAKAVGGAMQTLRQDLKVRCKRISTRFKDYLKESRQDLKKDVKDLEQICDNLWRSGLKKRLPVQQLKHSFKLPRELLPNLLFRIC